MAAAILLAAQLFCQAAKMAAHAGAAECRNMMSPSGLMGGGPAKGAERPQHFQHRKYPEHSGTHASCQQRKVTAKKAEFDQNPVRRCSMMRGLSVGLKRVLDKKERDCKTALAPEKRRKR
jgi:hypothetical protein